MSPWLWGIGALLALWSAAALVRGNFDPTVFIRGADGRPSSSKLPFVMWTAVVIFSYVSVFAAAPGAERWRLRVDVPEELLAVVALAAATLLAARGITVSHVRRGQVGKTAAKGGLSFLVSGDQGELDFTKAQMLAWTVIVMALYLSRLALLLRAQPSGRVALPTLEPSLVVLLGIGQAVYLGKKLVSVDLPRLSGLSPASGRAPLPLTIMGTAMGDKEGSSLTLDGMPVAVFVTSWTDEKIELTLPATRPDGTSWPRDRAVSVGLVTGGRASANTLLFTFA
jgi:hypothetical protein